jgi:polyhydroxyalkanoate synthesis regulator phasin
MSDVSDAYGEIENELDIKSGELTIEDYKEFLEDLLTEISSRINCIEEEEEPY